MSTPPVATATPVLGRRAMLAGACLSCVGVVAGCSSDSDAPETTAAAPAPSSAPSTATSSPAASPSAATSTAPAEPAPVAGLVALSKVPVGSAVVVKNAKGESVVVAQPTAGTVVGFSASCTHQGVTVAVDGKQLVCPRHGSRFQTSDGTVLNGPAEKSLPKFAVKVDGDQVVGA